MNEVPEILERAMHEPITLTFDDPGEARGWRYRAENHRRKAPHFKQLMIRRTGNIIHISRPTPTVTAG